MQSERPISVMSTNTTLIPLVQPTLNTNPLPTYAGLTNGAASKKYKPNSTSPYFQNTSASVSYEDMSDDQIEDRLEQLQAEVLFGTFL